MRVDLLPVYFTKTRAVCAYMYDDFIVHKAACSNSLRNNNIYYLRPVKDKQSAHHRRAERARDWR